MPDTPKLPRARRPLGHGTPVVTTMKLGVGDARQRNKKTMKRPENDAKPEPDGAPDHVFLPRAVEQVGQTRFGRDWAPELLQRALPRPIAPWKRDGIDPIDAMEAEQVAEKLRQIDHDEIPADDVSKEPLSSDTDWVARPDLWERARSHRAEEIARIENAFQQLEQAQMLLRDALRAGTIKTYGRAIRGGENDEKDPTFWNYERWHERFTTGRFNRDRPFGNVDSWEYPATHYIFVTRADLEAQFKLPVVERTDLNLLWSKLSPRIRVALIAAEEIERAGEQPRFDQLEARLMHLASLEGAVLGKILRQNLARIIRSNEDRSGVKKAHKGVGSDRRYTALATVRAYNQIKFRSRIFRRFVTKFALRLRRLAALVARFTTIAPPRRTQVCLCFHSSKSRE